MVHGADARPPIATDNVDQTRMELLIFTLEILKMTDWHWFSWYERPGVVSSRPTAVALPALPELTKLETKKKFSSR